MGFRSSALYLCLQTDLGRYLDAYQIREIESGRLSTYWPGATPKQVACQQLLLSVHKKFVDDISSDAEDKALAKFLQVNSACGSWDLEYTDTWDEILLGTFKSVLYDFFNPSGRPLLYSLEPMFLAGRVGPGASISARGNDFYTKLFSSRLSATHRSLYEWYRHHSQQLPDWYNAEVLRDGLYGTCDVVEGNRVSFVPKSNEISRTICTEPSVNMFYQLGMEQILLRRLDSFFGIDLATQQFKNRELARLGSLTGGWSTIDLSSASDSISLRMLKEVMPADQLEWFLKLRSPVSTLPSGERVVLNMISTMGNGYTFALQCILFSAVVLAAARCRGVFTPRDRGDMTVNNWGVNGDDIVCPSVLTGDVQRLLKLLGFTINAGKSFVEGLFRESCGGDYYCGHDVRGVFIKALDTPQARYVAINLFNGWTAKTGVSLPLTVQYLMRTVRYQPVPLWETPDSGVRLPLSFASGHVSCSRDGSFLYRKEIAEGMTYPIGLVHVTKNRRSLGRRRAYNPWGLLTAFLHGSIVSGSVSGRQTQTRYRTRRAVAPNWEFPSTSVESWLAGRTVAERRWLNQRVSSTTVAALHGAVMANLTG